MLAQFIGLYHDRFINQTRLANTWGVYRGILSSLSKILGYFERNLAVS